MPALSGRLSAIALTAATTSLLAGCGQAVTPSAAPAPAAARHRATAQLAAAPRAPELRSELQQLLGEHTILVVRLMRGRLATRPDFVQAASQALGRNTEDLSAAVGSAYGAAEGARFRSTWTSHVRYLAAYSSALASGDTGGQAAAKADLQRYTHTYGRFVARVTKGNIPDSAATANVQMHITDLLSQADAYAKKDYGSAYRIERTAYSHMFTTGRNLAAAVVKSRGAELPAGFDSPPQQLRSALGQLLGEHMQLAVDAMRSAATDNPDFSASAAALGGNTTDLQKAMEGLFGAAGARRFAVLWADHVDAVVAYSVAAGKKDDAGKAQARAKLATFAGGMAGFLSTAVAGKVTPGALLAALSMHDVDLMKQVDAYAAADYATSYAVALQAYRHMFAIADTLAGGIEAKLAGRLPKGGVQTGGGGTAGVRR